MGEIVTAIRQILELVSSDNVGKTLAVIAVLLLTGGGYLAYRLINQDPKQTALWQKTLVLSLVFAGLLFAVASPASTLWDRYNETQRKADETRRKVNLCEISKVVSASKSFTRLLANDRVDWLVRLIVYGKDESGLLEIQNLKTLGRPGQYFTFVADYQELRGRRVTEAARLMGTTLEHAQKVSVIIFPRNDRKIIPVNARGLLQAIEEVESTMPADAIRLEVRRGLGNKALNALKLDERKQSISSWAWENYKEFYPDYCKLVEQFRCKEGSQYAARAKLGELNDDWHPLGFSCQKPLFANPCNPVSIEKICEVRSTDELWRLVGDSYGVRVFFIRNEDLDTLDGRMLIDFDDPDEESIPILSLSQKESPEAGLTTPLHE